MQRWIVVGVASLSLLSAHPGVAQQPDWVGKKREEVRAGSVQGTGNWRATGEKQRALQRWSLDVERDADGGISGSVVIDDSPLLEHGRVRGKVNGRQVSGAIADSAGAEAVRFWGTIQGKSLRGTYTDRTGESGEWVWNGTLPE
jgi:hypothetical protein